MKKKLLLLPIIGLLLSGCDLTSIFTGRNKNSQEIPNIINHDEGNPNEKDTEEGGEKPSEIKVSSVALNEHSVNLIEGEEKQLTYTVLPENATNKNVVWSSSNSNIASVENGLVKAWNKGSATITITTVDQSKTDQCTFNVTSKPAPQVDTVTSELVFNNLGLVKREDNFTYEISVNDDEDTKIQFFQGAASFAPRCYDGDVKGAYEARAYAGHYFTVKNLVNPLLKIELVFSTKNDGSNPISTDVGSFSDNIWEGSSNEVRFTVGGESGHRRISAIKVTHEGKAEDNPDEIINLGNKSIAEVKQYILDHPVKKNAYGNGVNENRYVTISGFALAKIDLVKTKASYGLDVSHPAKVIMADATGYIGVATTVSGDGTTLWGKIDDHACESTSKYTVTGYISEYLGHPELMVTAFEWNKDLDITWNASIISEATTTLTGFYEKAVNVNYNCAGHGYGEVITINNLKCYFIESSGSGKRYYNFTDGEKNIRVNTFNLGSVSVGYYYNVTGIISLKNLSPIIVAFEITQNNSSSEFDFNWYSAATEITIANLKNIKGEQEDTSKRFPDVISAFGAIYKTTGYLTLVEENGKYYVGISDKYIAREKIISGKDNAMANYGISLIQNENFWNTTEEELYKYNPLFDNYILEDEPIVMYYVVRQLGYQSNKALWEILIIPDYLEMLKTVY